MALDLKIIAFGSSAGGIPPLRKILNALPSKINAAIVVVQHLSSEYPSKLNNVLQAATTLPVMKVYENTRIEQGKVYVIAEGKIMRLVDNTLLVRDRNDEEKKANKAIDYFFTSMAESAGEKALGVILSGAGNFDGIKGAVAVEHNGGTIIVQDPYTAEHPVMPDALIANDHPDFILTPQQIAEKILEWC